MNEITLKAIQKFFTNDEIEIYKTMWNQSHRYYHNITHLNFLCNKFYVFKSSGHLTTDNYDILILAALFHDIVYDPMRTDNEDRSIEILNESSLAPSIKNGIIPIIECTKYRVIPKEFLQRTFWLEDNLSIYNKEFALFVKHNLLLFKEFQFTDFSIYKQNRIDFLESNKETFRHFEEDVKYIENCIWYVKNWVPRIGFISMDYLTPYMLKQAEEIFDKIIIGYQTSDGALSDLPDTLKYKEVKIFPELVPHLKMLQEQKFDLTYICPLSLSDKERLISVEIHSELLKEQLPTLKQVFIQNN
jgi:predicted metal-dependent HD superfamily phosphohydrolase